MSSTQSKTEEGAPLLEGRVGPTMIRLAVPMVLGLLSIILFQVADTFYVGHLGIAPLAALSFCFPVTFLLISLSIGLSIGTASVIAQAVGRGDTAAVKCLITYGLLLAFVIINVGAVVGYFFLEDIFTLMGATPDLMPLIRDYMDIWLLGVSFLVVSMVGGSALRGMGDTKTQSKIMGLIGVLNIVIDPFLIFGWGPFPRLEIKGAALVTVMVWSLALVVTLVILKRRGLLLSGPFKMGELLKSWKSILHIGLPASLTNMVVPLSGAVMTRILAAFGEGPVAAFGVGTRTEALAVLGILALSAVITPFIGQNWGAGQGARVSEGFDFSVKFSLAWGVAVALLLALFARPVARLFTEEPLVLGFIQSFFYWVPISYVGYGIAVMANATLNALHYPYQATTLILLRSFVFSVPLAYGGSRLGGVQGMFAGIALGNLLSGALSYFWVRRFLRKLGCLNSTVVS